MTVKKQRAIVGAEAKALKKRKVRTPAQKAADLRASQKMKAQLSAATMAIEPSIVEAPVYVHVPAERPQFEDYIGSGRDGSTVYDREEIAKAGESLWPKPPQTPRDKPMEFDDVAHKQIPWLPILAALVALIALGSIIWVAFQPPV